MRIVVDIPDELEKAAHNMALRTHRNTEDVLREWLVQHVSEVPVNWLDDSRLLELIAEKLSDNDERELSDLLASNRERIMSLRERKRLDELMQIYGQGMVRKAEAMKEAVKRGLIPPLTG